MNILDNNLIEETLQRARVSERKRAIYCFHKPDDYLQRMINACLKDTYIAPHKHENPDKLEIFSIIKGKVVIIFFNDTGDIINTTLLDENGENKLVEIAPGTLHNLVVLSDEAVLYKIIEGKFNPDTHKCFAPWAPKEDDVTASKEYTCNLREKLGSEI